MSVEPGNPGIALAFIVIVIVLMIYLIVVAISKIFFPESSNVVYQHMEYSTPIRRHDDDECETAVAGELRQISLHEDIRVIGENLESCNRGVSLLKMGMKRSGYFFLGFDCEWRPNFSANQSNPVALLQLATLDGTVCLFRLCKMECIPHCLKVLLEDPMVYKVGVGSYADAGLIKRDYGVTMQGVFDLRHVPEIRKNALSLSKMSERYLGITLNKNMAFSEWDRDTLTQSQVLYAAFDAYVGVHIFNKFTKQMFDASCRGRTFCDDRLPTKILPACDGFCDVRRKIDECVDRDF